MELPLYRQPNKECGLNLSFFKRLTMSCSPCVFGPFKEGPLTPEVGIQSDGGGLPHPPWPFHFIPNGMRSQKQEISTDLTPCRGSKWISMTDKGERSPPAMHPINMTTTQRPFESDTNTFLIIQRLTNKVEEDKEPSTPVNFSH